MMRRTRKKMRTIYDKIYLDNPSIHMMIRMMSSTISLIMIAMNIITTRLISTTQ